jgi:hypothetical protein
MIITEIEPHDQSEGERTNVLRHDDVGSQFSNILGANKRLQRRKGKEYLLCPRLLEK